MINLREHQLQFVLLNWSTFVWKIWVHSFFFDSSTDEQPEREREKTERQSSSDSSPDHLVSIFFVYTKLNARWEKIDFIWKYGCQLVINLLIKSTAFFHPKYLTASRWVRYKFDWFKVQRIEFVTEALWSLCKKFWLENRRIKKYFISLSEEKKKSVKTKEYATKMFDTLWNR